MKRRQIIQSLAMTLIGGGALLGQRLTAAAPEKPEKPSRTKRIPVGRTIRFDKDLSVTFLAVLKDVRCPINATCISAGNAVVSLRVKAGNQKPKVISLNTDGVKKRSFTIPAYKLSEGMAAIPKSYTISIASLDPLPFAGKKTKQSDYRLRLDISVAY
ncbi:MAG: hypothetical protein EOP85_08870 [Verrucomicrobiaceae bacterium]|nr:MAG: hypothetical protein EOP85_08870 [Verrucomicrobiaceae bacterium]